MRHLTSWAVLLLVGGAAVLFAARNYGGEVATLYTTDGTGRTFQSSVWVVDKGPQVWLRATSPTSPWLDRIVNHPEVELLRGESLKTFRATPLVHRRERINADMAQAYGWAEWVLAKVEDRSEAVPVFLDPFG